jgi:hypothetical protein
VVAEMKDAAGCRHDRTEGRVTTAAKANHFASDTTFLSGELKGDEGSCKQLVRRGSGGRKGKVSQKEANILKQKGLRHGDNAGVFTGPQKKEKG